MKTFNKYLNEKLKNSKFKELYEEEKKIFSIGDENNLILVGFLAFFDQPKQSAKETIKD